MVWLLNASLCSKYHSQWAGLRLVSKAVVLRVRSCNACISCQVACQAFCTHVAGLPDTGQIKLNCRCLPPWHCITYQDMHKAMKHLGKL